MMRDFNMLPNIVDHSVQVKKVALAIVDNLTDRKNINRDLVLASALLHDIAKTRTIETGEMRHDIIGAEMMREMGYPEIADIIECHVVLSNFSTDTPVEEREIVFYADKRVMHDRIVTIDERINDISMRYGKYVNNPEIIEKSRIFALSVEKKIASYCSSSLEEIISSL